MRLLKVILLFLLPGFSQAQDNPLYVEPSRDEADSFRLVLKQDINDTLRMAAYRELSLFYLDINTDSALYFIGKALPLAQKLNLKLWEADALDLMAINLRNQGNYTRSLKAFNEALKITESRECEENIWRISKFTQSNKPEFARLSLLATIQSDMVELYAATANYDRELRMVRQCFAIATQIKDYTLLSQAYRHLGQIYTRTDRLDSALSAYEKYFECAAKAGFRKYSHLSFNNIGNIYLKKELYRHALKNYRNALQISKEQNNYWGIGSSYIAIAKYYIAINKNDSALYHAKAGLATLKSSGQVRYYNDAYTTLVSIYKNLNMPDSALLHMEIASAIKDSLVSLEKIKQFQNVDFDEQLRLQELEKESIKTKSRIRTYSLLTGLGIILIVAFILYRNNLQKQKANKVLEATLADLKSTQAQLIQSEKMASLGELTAGIAHEIQNPLNFVNNFSEVNSELILELNQEAERGNLDEVRTLAKDIQKNEEKIAFHGKRADAIVKSMLQHSRTSSGKKELTDINALCDEYLRLAYHGYRAKDKSFNARFETDLEPSLPQINIVPQDIGRVVLNLINNAFYVVNEKRKANTEDYEPTVTVSTSILSPAGEGKGVVQISVKDNGPGIPDTIKEKIFQPFFTTKPTGQGTGLGLSLSYDIVKAHGGEFKVETKEGGGTEFSIQLPVA
ncbi:MAG: ATP-binding protein [Cyclobacteriaceae bacterium]|jgi:signal transduction histidine kinase|nr:ATP-binding protein [Cyclobacteriaceae bacterium]MCU0397392.1 ATP-binding protein [Cyclobacteriaceae bacterium]